MPNLPMMTFFLLLGIHPHERPDILRRCRAENKIHAAREFAERLNTRMSGTLYLDSELLPAIKREDALTEPEKQWISAEDDAWLDL
jgi:hypothetical protein